MESMIVTQQMYWYWYALYIQLIDSQIISKKAFGKNIITVFKD